MRTLLSALAVGLLVLVAAPQNALACHKGDPGIPHGNQTTCDGLPPLSVTKIVFITSTIFADGNLGGIVGADAECQALADAASLSGTFLAWLSDSLGNSPATDPNFVKSEVPYLRVDGIMVASSWADLVDGSLLAPIEVDEQGNHPGTVTDPATSGDVDRPHVSMDRDRVGRDANERATSA